MSQLRCKIALETWPLAEPFVISRGARTEAHVIVVELDDGHNVGRGECVPYARYGESIESVAKAINAVAPSLSDRVALQELLPAGAARNALDCAFWDLEAKRRRQAVYALAGLAAPEPFITCYTLSLGSPESMAAKAQSVASMSLLKLKLGGGAADASRMRAVRAARPDARLVADANESWQAADLPMLLAVAAECGLEVVEQPLPADDDRALATVKRLVPVCADESVHVATDIEGLVGRYDAVNIKLDKSGGLTAAIDAVAEARRHGLDVMVGCMVGTSLAMAPATLLARSARWVDLDAPLLLATDRPGGLRYDAATAFPASTTLWG